jgi:YD repeat-containing protein
MVLERGDWWQNQMSYDLIIGEGKVRMDIMQTSGSYVACIGATAMTTGSWHHIAGIYDGSQMRVYVDGVLDGSATATMTPGNNATGLRIGKSSFLYYPNYFNGRIDEVRVSNTALYTGNFTPSAHLTATSSTKGLWKFDGENTNDASASGANGSLQGGATYSTDVPTSGGPQVPVAIANGPYTAQLGQSITFSNSGSFDPDGTISSYHWNFGDGTSANTQNPSHVYQTSGFFTATITVTDNAGLRASTTAAVTISGANEARLDPRNRTGGGGENPLSQNFNWNLPLVNLPGRAGMDLGLMLSYNSLVWTRNTSGNSVSFDEDRGFPSPGFRLGFPVIQPPYFNSEVGKYAFLLIGPDGSRIELRQVGTSSLYEAADSSHLLLDSTIMTVLTSDGTQLSYAWMNSDYNCTKIKDRNGNYITIKYMASGKIDHVIDTLARSLKFNYDANGLLTSITQIWNQGSQSPVTHNWAVFTYADTLIQTNFTGLTVYGPTNNSNIKTLSKVTLADGSHTDFSYTSWGQVWKVSNFAPNNDLLNYRAYNLPGSPLLVTGPQDDCPRFTQRRDWAKYWNGDTNGDPGVTPSTEDAVTSFAVPVIDSWTMPDGTSATGKRVEVTSPDGTINKIYFIGTPGDSSAWRRGLPALVVTESGGGWQRKVMTTWTQDNTSVFYPLNPRVTETNIYDPSGNRARTTIAYQHHDLTNGTSCDLPKDVFEYAANATTVLRSTRTTYNVVTPYTNRHILGLVSVKSLYEGDVDNGGTLMSKLAFFYDESGSISGSDAPVQHDDTNYSSTFVTGRGNLSSVNRYDVTNTNVFTTTSSKYNTAGAVVSSTDAAAHTVIISYTDAFSDGTPRNALAYPTMVTDPGGYSSTSKYNFDFGAVTRTQTPEPNTTENLPGPEQSSTFDSIGRLQQVTNIVNNAYTRFEYAVNGIRVDTYATIQEGVGEAHSFKYFDGTGRVIGTATDHNANTFSGQKIVYDVMGRVIKTSNPTETSASGAPSQWDTTADDAATGWIYTEQTYDWKGRPLVTTNPSITGNPADITTKQVSYTGCGCAGGEVATLTDEGTIDAGVAKRRKQKVYSDVLGRVVKSELFNWEDGGIYSTTINTYNARDQITQIRQYQGGVGSSTYQDTTSIYDGFGRLYTSHAPEQQPESNNPASSDHTTIYYNADDTINHLVDARGVVKSFTYNNRRMVTGRSYGVENLPVAPTANIAFTYDAVGNRLEIRDGSGKITYQYNTLSQLTSETREFSGGLSGINYTLNYQYNLGGKLKKITDHTNTTINYNYNRAGQLNAVTGENNLVEGVSTYASGFEYRAWGVVRTVNFGNGTTQQTSFNQRLLPTNSSLSNVLGFTPISWSYDYYSDGRQRHAYDGVDNRFDRLVEFDHIGRIKEAYSGREARGLPATNPADSPYRQSFQYNAFGDRTQKSGRFWRMTQSGTTPCAPRQIGDGCDAQGNPLFQGGNHYYDAEEQQVSFEDWDNPVGGTPNHPQSLPGVTIGQTYDGNGQPAKRIETRRSQTLINGGPNANITETITTTYYIYSSVLGGAEVVELDANGNKVSGYVYANGTRLAKQNIHPSSSTVTWHHFNPGTNSWVETDSGRAAAFKQMDPDGAEVGVVDPWATIEVPATYENLKKEEPLYIDGGDPFDYVSGFTLDGMPMTRSQLDRILGKLGGSSFLIFDVMQGVRVFDSINRAWVWPIGTISIDLQGKKKRPNAPRPQPQKSATVPLQTTEELRDAFKELLSNKICKDFVDQIITLAESHVPESQRLNLGFEDLFENISGQGGYILKPNLTVNGYGVSGLVDRGRTSIASGNAQAEIRERGYFTTRTPGTPSPMESYSAQRRSYLASAFHETFHHIGKTYAAYSDESLGMAAFSITGDTYDLPTDHDPLKWSSYFDHQLMKHCMPDLIRHGNISPP